MQGEIVERPLSHFIGLRVTAPYESITETVRAARKDLLARQYLITSILNPYEQVGVTRPQDQESVQDQVTTYIGFLTGAAQAAPEGMTALELPAGSYARFEWHGPFDSNEFEAFYPSIFGWFKESGYVPSNATPWMEIYGRENDWDDPSNPENGLTVLMPLAGRSASP